MSNDPWKKIGPLDIFFAWASVCAGIILLSMFCTLATSCAPRFHPTKRPADTELRTTPR